MMMQAKAKMHMQANTTTKALAQGADAVQLAYEPTTTKALAQGADAVQLAYDDGV